MALVRRDEGEREIDAGGDAGEDAGGCVEVAVSDVERVGAAERVA